MENVCSNVDPAKSDTDNFTLWSPIFEDWGIPVRSPVLVLKESQSGIVVALKVIVSFKSRS